MGKTSVVAGLPQGTPIWIFWDDDQTFYRGQVGPLSEDGKMITIFYPENEESEKIDLEDFEEGGEIKYTLEDPAKEQVQVAASAPEVSEVKIAGRVAQGGNPLIQQLRKLGTFLIDIEDRLPNEGLENECDAVWLSWRTFVSTAKTVEELAMFSIYLSQQIKPNVSTAWWKKESKYWRITARYSSSVEDLYDHINQLLTEAIDWGVARSLFPPPPEPYPEGTIPPTPRKNRVTLVEPRKKRRFESMRPAGKPTPPKNKKIVKDNEKRLLMLRRIGKLEKGPKKLKVGKVAGGEEGEGVKRPKVKLKRKREEGEGGVNKRPKSAKVAAPPRVLVMPKLPPIGEKLSAEGLDAKDGVAAETVAVSCNNVQAEYVPGQHMVACRCAQCGGEGKLLTCQQFEAHTGSRAKKWKETIRLAAIPTTRLSEWLSMMEKKGVSGVAFVAIENKRVKALGTSDGAGAPRGDRPSSGNADAAKLRKAFAAKLAKERKKAAVADVAPSAPGGGAAPLSGEAAGRGGDTGASGADVAAKPADVEQGSGHAKDRNVDGGHVLGHSEVGTTNQGVSEELGHDPKPTIEGAEGLPDAIRDERVESPMDDEDPIGWFNETYLSPTVAADALETFMPYDGLPPNLSTPDGRLWKG